MATDVRNRSSQPGPAPDVRPKRVALRLERAKLALMVAVPLSLAGAALLRPGLLLRLHHWLLPEPATADQIAQRRPTTRRALGE